MKTHKTDTGIQLIAAVVPRTAKGLRINEHPSNPQYSVLHDGDGTIFEEIEHSEDDLKLIGTAHPSGFNFDPAPFVEKVFATFTPGFPEIIGYTNYMDGYSDAKVDGADLSMLSLLQSWGYYWDNPEMHPSELHTTNRRYYEIVKKRWQEAESRKLSVDQMVVLIKINRA